MFRVPNDDAMNANAFVRRGGKWNPDTHWIVSLAEENEAAFVQTLLDKYAAHVQAYSILPMWTDDTFVIELQFHDDTVGLQCEGEYLKAFRKGGIITDLKKSRRRKATKRLRKNRMYRLPDGEFFWYYALWDGHGNVIGKVFDRSTGMLRNRVVNRTLLEEGELIPSGDEPWLPA